MFTLDLIAKFCNCDGWASLVAEKVFIRQIGFFEIERERSYKLRMGSNFSVKALGLQNAGYKWRG